MFEALLKRISNSKYKKNIIIKGGFLLSSIFGIDARSTMDMDVTIKEIALEKENLEKIIKEIINIDIKDDIKYEIFSIKDIRLEKKYPGYRIHLLAFLDNLRTHLLIDVTTGDVITIKEIDYKYNNIFDNEQIDIMTYNLETIIAEKFETIITRNITNSRMKDFYDIYMLITTKWSEINKNLLSRALQNTFSNRNSNLYYKNINNYISLISNSNELKCAWYEYQKRNPYAQKICYEDIIKSINKINELIK